MTNDINQLLPMVKQKCEQFIAKCAKDGVQVAITGTFRTFEEQDALYAKGRTSPGPIVTNAKGGQSLHNWKVAFDCVPVVDGTTVYNDDALWSKLAQIGASCGLEWGGSWQSFPDKPHFQYTLGYSWQDFLSGTVDLSKFNLPNMEDNSTTSPQTPAEAAGTTGNAVLFELRSKATGEVVSHIAQGSDSNNNFFMRLEDGTDVVFVNGENPNYTFTTLN